MERDKRFAALALTLKYDGLKLLCMIRLCPLPYSICNGAVSTFPTVQPLMYGLATAIISPKLLVPAFVGSRIRLLSEKGEEMSAGSKAVNVCSIIITVGIGIFTGWYIYQRFESFPPGIHRSSMSSEFMLIFVFPFIELWPVQQSSKPRSVRICEAPSMLTMHRAALMGSPRIRVAKRPLRSQKMKRNALDSPIWTMITLISYWVIATVINQGPGRSRTADHITTSSPIMILMNSQRKVPMGCTIMSPNSL